MNIANFAKNSFEKFQIPYSVGACISLIPYGIRPGLGTIYRQRKGELQSFAEMSLDEKSNFVFVRTKSISTYAFHNVEFYRQYYQRHGFDPSQLSSFDDLKTIPIVNKTILREYNLNSRSCQQPGMYLANTGGSSGSPLNFYILPSSMGHEWAHMHHIWAKLGYRPHNLKICFAGRNIKDVSVSYDPLRHHYALNIYRSNEDIAKSLKKLLVRSKVLYIHGYPSAIYDFACYCKEHDPELVQILRKNLKGAFLGSEFPTPIYRDMIESVFNIPSVSWYGHTERTILAWEKYEPFVYHPFQSYGYAEAVEDSETKKTKLVGTSYYNTASPFIRYDTGDEIKVEHDEGGILESFRIDGGREGDYVIDNTGKRISLTGLVFGRHHKIFDRAKFVQIYQDCPGKATFYITPTKSPILGLELENNFDLDGIDIHFEFKQIDEPIVSPSGKVILKIKEINYTDFTGG